MTHAKSSFSQTRVVLQRLREGSCYPEGPFELQNSRRSHLLIQHQRQPHSLQCAGTAVKELTLAAIDHGHFVLVSLRIAFHQET